MERATAEMTSAREEVFGAYQRVRTLVRDDLANL
jgi:hypothetical protein